MCAALMYASSFHYLVEDWTDCEEPKPKTTDNWVFAHRKYRQTNTEHYGVQPRTNTDARYVGKQKNNKQMKISGNCHGPEWMAGAHGGALYGKEC